MSSIKVKVAGWEAEIEIPDDELVMDYLRYEMLIKSVSRTASQISVAEGEGGQPEALEALMSEIHNHFEAILPAVTLSVESKPAPGRKRRSKSK